MKIHQVRWCTLNKLEIRFQYVTNTLQKSRTLVIVSRYTLLYADTSISYVTSGIGYEYEGHFLCS